MPRKRNNGLSEEKRNIIGQLVEMYDIKTAADIQEALKDLLGGTIMNRVRASEGFQEAVAKGVDMDDLTAGVYSAANAFRKIAFIAGIPAPSRCAGA